MPLTSVRLPVANCSDGSPSSNTVECAEEESLQSPLLEQSDKTQKSDCGHTNGYSRCDSYRTADHMTFLPHLHGSTQKVADVAGGGFASKRRQINETRESSDFFFGHYTRYVVLALSTLCLSLTMSNALALNFTIICMTPDSKEDIESLNITSSETVINDDTIVPNAAGEKFLYSQAEKSALFSAVALGTLIGTMPITFFTANYGVRRTFTCYGLISAISTLLSPLCASIGFFPLVAMRVFQGIALSTSFPAMGSIIAHWSTLRNSGMYIALLSCHLQFGPIFTMPVAGELCSSRWGWPSIYYLQGTLTLLAFAVFYLFFTDMPRLHRNVSGKELKTIEKNKNLDTDSAKQNVPYRAILKDNSVWGVLASNFGGNLGFQIFMQYGPIYLNKALKFNIQNTGFAAALPYVLSALVKFVVGPFSDHFTCVSAKARIIIFATSSQLLMSCCFLALAFTPMDYPFILQACFTSCTMFSGLNCVGVAKSTQLMSRQFAHVLMALGALINSIVVLLLPLIVAVMAPNNTTSEWSQIFILIAVIVIVTTFIFNFTAEVDPRPWTYSSKMSQAALLRSKSKLSSAEIATVTTPAGPITPSGCKTGDSVSFSVPV